MWDEQSREFARLRGEIVDAPTPPAVEKPNRTTAYRLSLDGFLFWPDNTPCEIPLPDGTRIVSAPTPPYYRANDRSDSRRDEVRPNKFCVGVNPMSWGERRSGGCMTTASYLQFGGNQKSKVVLYLSGYATPEEIPGWNGSAGDIQAVCGFRCWASKRTPFFQTSKVMAAILRAKVRRAISGRIPLASSAL